MKQKKPVVYAFVDILRHSLAYKKDQRRRSVETLGLSGHGDSTSVADDRAGVNDRKEQR